jgi:hypothetical protein
MEEGGRGSVGSAVLFFSFFTLARILIVRRQRNDDQGREGRSRMVEAVVVQ